MKISKVIFDMDGTLINTIGSIGYNVNMVLKNHGWAPHPIEAYRNMVGYGLDNTMYAALPEEVKALITKDSQELNQLVGELVAYYEEHYIEETSLYDGIEDLITFLEENHISYGIHTNKKQLISNEIAKHYFKGSLFLGNIGPSDEVPLKPNPQGTFMLIGATPKEEVLYVGDTEVDAETAIEAGINAVLVSWGFRNANVLDLFDFPIVDSPEELRAYIEKSMQ